MTSHPSHPPRSAPDKLREGRPWKYALHVLVLRGVSVSVTSVAARVNSVSNEKFQYNGCFQLSLKSKSFTGYT